MRFIEIIIVVLAVGLILLAACGKSPLLRGMLGNSFASNARPVFAVNPVSGLRLNFTGLAEISPESDKGDPQARAWFAIYGGSNTAASLLEAGNAGAAPVPMPGVHARLVVLFLEVDGGRFQWDPDASRNLRNPIRTYAEGIGPFNAEEATYTLLPGAHPLNSDIPRDPFDGFFSDAADRWNRGSLVRRFTSLPSDGSAKLIIEYREPLPAGIGTAQAQNLQGAVDPEYLLAFERRAKAAFEVSSTLPDEASGIVKLEYPPKEFSRTSLSYMAGMLRNYLD